MSADSKTVSEEIQDAASAWLSRRDRGLTAAEQDAYLEWLYRDPAHGRAIVLLERVWSSLNKLEQWRPVHSATPNPDLLAPRRGSRLVWWSSMLAAAAAIAVALYVGLPSRPAPTQRAEAIIHPGPEKMSLADGSIIELNQGAKVDVRYTPAERQVRLLTGEAHFTVAKNPDRPFVVDTGRVSVRAVGTAFSVALATAEVAVLVTEGRVQVVQQAADGSGAATPDDTKTVYLAAGQQTVVDLGASPGAIPAVREMTPAEIDRAMAWQGLRLEFADMPLRDVAETFNRFNREKLVLADEVTGAVTVGGSFRADNVEAFVRLLESGFGIHAERDGQTIRLRQGP